MPRRLKLLAAAATTVALLAGAWFWLRDSSLVRVRAVEITGVTAPDGDRVRTALEDAAREMTTLHVRTGVLRDAVRPFDSVEDVRVSTDFPHGMTLQVLERRPVAALVSGERRVPVTGSGRVLPDLPADVDLPDLRLTKPLGGDEVQDRRLRAALAVAGAAPAPLLHRAQRLWWGPRGLMLDLRDGPELVFGSSADARTKWAAAARVLAEPSAGGALYLDLRVPGRVAAGGLEPVPTPTPALATANPQPQGENGPTLNP